MKLNNSFVTTLIPLAILKTYIAFICFIIFIKPNLQTYPFDEFCKLIKDFTIICRNKNMDCNIRGKKNEKTSSINNWSVTINCMPV